MIYPHENINRERFTLSHEIGHFYLEHGKYICNETVVEQDLFVDYETKSIFNYDRLEYQANVFASALLLPKNHCMHRFLFSEISMEFMIEGTDIFLLTIKRAMLFHIIYWHMNCLHTLVYRYRRLK